MRVERAGSEVIVAGSAKPVRSVAAARGVLAGGVLFGQNPLLDAAELRIGGIIVHHVERGSDGEAQELARGDFVEAVDGEALSSLEQLTGLLEQARAERSP